MYMEIGGTYNPDAFSGNTPYSRLQDALCELADGTNNRFAYAMVDSTQCLSLDGRCDAGTQAFCGFQKIVNTAVHHRLRRCGNFFWSRKADIPTLSKQWSGISRAGHNQRHWRQSACSVSSSFAGFLSGGTDATQLLTQILFPAGSSSGYCYVQNANGTYAGGNGNSFRVSICASTKWVELQHFKHRG